MRIKNFVRLIVGGAIMGYACYTLGSRNKHTMQRLADFRDVLHNLAIPGNTWFVQFTFKPSNGIGYPEHSGGFEISLRDRDRHIIGTSVEVKKVILTKNDFDYFNTHSNTVELGVRQCFTPEELKRRAREEHRRRNRNHR